MHQETLGLIDYVGGFGEVLKAGKPVHTKVEQGKIVEKLNSLLMTVNIGDSVRWFVDPLQSNIDY